MTAGSRRVALERAPTTPRRRPRVVALLAILAVVSVATPPAAAQEEPERTCRCVDADGNEIEGCRCHWAGPPLPGLAPLPPHPPEAMAWSMAAPRRARLGVTLGSPGRGQPGAPIEEVMAGGAAERAGLRAGDVIVALDGQALSEPVEREREGEMTVRGDPAVPRLLEILGDMEPGEPVEIAYLRDGERRTATITPDENPGWERMERLRKEMGSLGERLRLHGPRMDALRERLGEAEELRLDALRERLGDLEGLRLDAEGLRGFRYETPEGRVRAFRGEAPRAWSFGGGRCPGDGGEGLAFDRSCVAGAELVELNPSLGEYFGTPEGVLVPDIADDSPLGLRAGDVILAVGGRAVTTPEDVRRILASYDEDEEVAFRILRQRVTMEVMGRVGR
ncbi:MAG: PDZ domain-containing protein [Gemmatimonadetes bacterium]|nr:PDZ domain-containing protein [Gemmatimonadota bacterium]